jgi:hypothetical protein
MDSKELVSRLKEMIMEDQVQQVVALLLQEHQRLDVPFSEADLLQISGRLSSIEREKNLGIITNEQYSIARNQLRQLLVDKVLSIEKPKPAIPPTPVTVPLENGDQLLAQGQRPVQQRSLCGGRGSFSKSSGKRVYQRTSWRSLRYVGARPE